MDGCGSKAGDSQARLRWAVNIAKWHPEGDHEGAEFQFLLHLLPANEREDCLKMRFMPDKKRAIVSRLLQRAACAHVTSIPFERIVIKRTKGRKPFLADISEAQPPRLPHAPNFNFNVSHEGDFVVLASEPSAICGVDVAAPGQARRPGKDGRMPTAEEMLQTFSDVFTPHEKERIRAAADVDHDFEDDEQAKEEVFKRHWSLKEALVKAMGVGLALDLGRAEFHTGGDAGGQKATEVTERRGESEMDNDACDSPRRSSTGICPMLYRSPSRRSVFISDGKRDENEPGDGNGTETARLILDGVPKPKWRFFIQSLGESKPGPNGGRHWVTVSRGPTEDVTDANGEFSATWRKPEYTDEEWREVLDAPSPHFSMLAVGDLVPENFRAAYEAAGGEVLQLH